MTKNEVLVTGANGEVGHALIKLLKEKMDCQIVALDLKDLDQSLVKYCSRFYKGSVADKTLIDAISGQHNFSRVYHLAAILSTGGERNPILAQEVNVGGSFLLLSLAKTQSELSGVPVIFFQPSTIAAYGVPSVEVKQAVPKVDEDIFPHPITMYGINKRYVEEMGRYFSTHFKVLDDSAANVKIDFRCIRFPGIISADSMPSGGTSDYGPEMLHAAAQGKPYKCFVRPDSRLPFMVMADAVRAIIELSTCDKAKLSKQVYNVGSFTISAEEIRAEVLKYFPNADIGYEVNQLRQSIVDSWPGDVDTRRANSDWGWIPTFNKERSFSEYLIPAVKRRYSVDSVTAISASV